MADTSVLFVLHESAIGYALFEVIAFDEIGSLIENASASVTDLTRFGRAIKLKAFTPFTSAIEALENANAISEHAMTGTLHNFLELHLPKLNTGSAKKSKTKGTAAYSLGVIDPGLATAIIEGFSTSNGTAVACRSDDTIREIIRGCRFHFDTYIKGLQSSQPTSSSSSASAALESSNVSVKAQLGLGHSYSRSKVKFNPARSDNMIIQSIALLDQLDKDINTFAMRIREWYSWHFPELKDIVKDNIAFARTAAFVQNKATLFTSSSSSHDPTEDDTPMNGDHDEHNSDSDKLMALSEIVGDIDTATLIVTAAKTSMGMECSSIDMLNIINFTQRMIKMAEYRKQLQFYLSDKMNMVAPNLSALIGDSVAARLISKVRWIIRLSSFLMWETRFWANW
jgi:nucleolar protein 56